MGDPAVILVERGARQAAVVEGGGAVQAHVVAAGLDGVAERLDNSSHCGGVHGAVGGRFDIIEDGIVELSAVENGEAELGLLLRHLRRGGVAEVVHADGDVVRDAAGVVLLKAGVLLRGPVFAAVAGADDGEVYHAAVGDGGPIDVALIIGDVNAHQGDVHLAGGVAAVREIGRDGGDAVADALHAPVGGDGGDARVARVPGRGIGGAAAGEHEERAAFPGPERHHSLIQGVARVCRDGYRHV